MPGTIICQRKLGHAAAQQGDNLTNPDEDKGFHARGLGGGNALSN